MPLYSLITLNLFFHVVTFSVEAMSRQEIHFSKPCRQKVGSWPHSHTCTSCLTSSYDWNLLARRCFFHVGEEMKVRRCWIQAVGRVFKYSPAPSFVSTHTAQYPLRNCVIHENCGAWATKVLPSSNQCLNFKWIKRHLTMWSYLVAIK